VRGRKLTQGVHLNCLTWPEKKSQDWGHGSSDRGLTSKVKAEPTPDWKKMKLASQKWRGKRREVEKHVGYFFHTFPVCVNIFHGSFYATDALQKSF
jgi:hypothetical protein